jgi:benzoylformate decarboxylase
METQVQAHAQDPSASSAATVRDAAFDALRRLGMTTMFANPGSTEVALLAGLPDDLEFVLALHEGSVVGMAAGHAIGRGTPSLVLLHSMPGFGNAVAALATARLNRAPLVVIVGQQDRRHLELEPFLAGRLNGLAGEYPVWVDHPVRAQDVPGAIVRAHHEAITGRGPAIVVVPMDDWLQPAPAAHEVFGAARVLRSAAADDEVVEELAALLDDAESPVVVSGAGADSPAGWAAMVALAQRLGCPVWQEPFGPQAGFPQDHPQFAGHLPARRARLREVLAAHDTVLVVGTGMLRQYPYDEGPLVAPGTRVAVVSADPAEAHRSPVDLAVLGAPAAICAALAEAVTPRPAATGTPLQSRPPAPTPPAPGEPLRAAHVLAALGDRLPRETIIVEESPSSRQQLNAHIPAREPMGFVSAMGLLGFGMPASIGLKMALPDRPVMAVLGDGSSLYSIQALWSAVQYRAGVVFVILVNGGYAIMDRLSEKTGQAGPWPALAGLDIGGFARAQGCDTARISTHDELIATLDEVAAGLATRETPLLLEAVVAQDPTFDA